MYNTTVKNIICVFLFCGSVVSAINAGATVQQNDTIWISDIPELDGKQIYGNVIYNKSHKPTEQTYGGSESEKGNDGKDHNYLMENYNQLLENEGLTIGRDPQKGLYFLKPKSLTITSITVYEVKTTQKTSQAGNSYFDYSPGNKLTVDLPARDSDDSNSTENHKELKDTATVQGDQKDDNHSGEEGSTWPTYVFVLFVLLGFILLGIFLLGYLFYLMSNRFLKIEKDIIESKEKKGQGIEKSFLTMLLKKDDLEELKQMLLSAKQEVIKMIPKQSDLKGGTKFIQSSHESIKPLVRDESPQTKNVANEFLGYAEMTLENYLTRTSSNEMAVFEINQKNGKIIFNLVSNPTIRQQLTSRGDILRKMRENGIIDFDDEDLNGARNTNSGESGILKVGQAPDTYVPLSPLKLKFVK